MSTLLSLEEAQSRLLARAPEMVVEYVAPGHAYGQYLSDNLAARRTQPVADLSAMDGYAICGDGPWTRVGESRAGAPFAGLLKPGQCTRISTGAHMPGGADRVLIQENAEVEGAQIRLAAGEELPSAGRHVRKRGFDFNEGDQLLEVGTRLGPAQIALAISGGHGDLPIRRKPRIAILDSGDELAADPAKCGPDQIPASNGAMIEAMLAPMGCETVRLGPVRDDLGALAEALQRSESSDIVITSGGASVGDHDLIQQSLAEWGAELAFWKVAIKPGKPLMVATRQHGAGKQVILGLPGNPVSSFVTCFLFGLPLVRAAMGDHDPLPGKTRLVADEDLPAVGKRREFLRGVSDGTQVRLAASQDSSALRALASANCLIERNEDTDAVKAGEIVEVYNFQNG